MKSKFYIMPKDRLWSLPSRERGLKLYRRRRNTSQLRVAPFAGAWIEIEWHVGECFLQYVAPFAGAWIEILFAGGKLFVAVKSLPSRERGLKFKFVNFVSDQLGRSLRGSVD